jgi:iron-sulfur cluster assembly accessory protein
VTPAISSEVYRPVLAGHAAPRLKSLAAPRLKTCGWKASASVYNGARGGFVHMAATTTSISIGRKPELVTLTDAAVRKVAELISREDDAEALVLRVAVKPGGCSGFSYDLFFDTEVADDDTVVTFPVPDSEGSEVRVAIDPASAGMVKGSTLDYTDGLSGAGFSFSNPNATRTCGCGSSFS